MVMITVREYNRRRAKTFSPVGRDCVSPKTQYLDPKHGPKSEKD